MARSSPTSAEVASMLDRATALHGAGRLAEADALYRQILAAAPDHFDALNLLGIARFQRGDYTGALRQFDAALAIDPDSAVAHATRGVALQKLGRPDEAVASYDRAVALAPQDASTFYNRGNALQALERFEAAVESYERAIALRPDHAGALYNRGNALAALGRTAEALASYDGAIALKRDHMDALNNRAVALQHLGRLDEAIAGYDAAIAVGAANASTYFNRAVALHELRRFADAVISFDRAIALDAGAAASFLHRGNALHSLNRFSDAVASFDRAIALRPDYAEAFNNRSIALKELKRIDQALASCDKAIELKPDYADAHNNRGVLLQELRRLPEAMTSYAEAIALKPDHGLAFSGLADCVIKACDWAQLGRVSGEIRRHVVEGRSQISPFLLLGYGDDASLQLTCASNYVRDRVGAVPRRLASREVHRNDKIKLAYLSSDFRLHPLSFLMAELFEIHDRSRFEVIGVSYGPDDHSDMRSRLIAAFDRFIDVRTAGDEEAAALLDGLHIDIAVDLNGHTQGARTGILAFRPAPIQASYMGLPATMGADFIDYIIADSVVVPFEEQGHYSERIIHLPDCYMVNDRKRAISSRTPTRQEVGLPAEGFVFCCFSNNWKITPEVFDIWMRLLTAVGGSVLWLFRDNAEAERNLRREAAMRGVDPVRLVFADRMPLADHLARHRVADIFLDTLPYNAHTTASDALWTGLPLLTCRGKTFAGRVAASLLMAIGLPELVTESLTEYEALALRIATDGALRRELREKLDRNRMTMPLFDTERFGRHMEAAYTTMWELWQRGEPPCSFGVEPRQDGSASREISFPSSAP